MLFFYIVFSSITDECDMLNLTTVNHSNSDASTTPTTTTAATPTTITTTTATVIMTTTATRQKQRPSTMTTAMQQKQQPLTVTTAMQHRGNCDNHSNHDHGL
jgi:hypothetical protein